MSEYIPFVDRLSTVKVGEELFRAVHTCGIVDYIRAGFVTRRMKNSEAVEFELEHAVDPEEKLFVKE